jgi:DNA topoisomerase-1
MELIVAEKPKVAEKIAYAICDKVERKALGGISYYTGIASGTEVAVAPAVGHIYTLVEKSKVRAYPALDIEWVPSFKAEKAAAYTKAYVSLLESLGKKAKMFTAACDYDIEGSLIGYNVFRFAYGKKAAARMKFSALTTEDLREAYAERGELDYNNAYAGEARHILDWYYGINLSRALMAAIKSANRFRVMSIGRVQGPALNILAQLEIQIKNFVPTPYWEVTVQIKGIEFMHSEGRFEDEELASAALDKTKKDGAIESVEKKEQTILPNPPFDLTSLQVEAYRVFGFAPARTLELAQTLYESSLISYPRTSSQKLSSKLNLPGIVKKLSENSAYSKSANEILSNKWFKPFEGKKEDPAHPAIHPTGQSPGKLEEQERKLYDLIVKRFLALFAPSAKKERTAVLVNSNGENYQASGVITTEKGWIDFYGEYYKTEDKELPEFSKGEKVPVEKKKKTKKETKPPRRYTDASIISELEDRHLGTKATRSTIIETLHKRGYMTGKSIQVSDFGLEVVKILGKYAPEILDENMTRKLEDDMESIQDGKMDKDEVVHEGKEILIQILDKFKKNENKIGTELLGSLETTEKMQSQVGVCDKCGAQLRIIKMRMGKQFIGCGGYPNCRNAYPLPTGAWVTPTGKPCGTCGKPTVIVKMKGRNVFQMCVDPKCPTKADWGKKKTTDAAVKAEANAKTEANPAAKTEVKPAA